MEKKLTKKKRQELEKAGPLGGKVTQSKNAKTGEILDLPDDGRDYTKEVEKTRALGIPDIQKVQIRNPVTRRSEVVTIDRRGTTDDKLGAIMLSPTSTKEQKESLVSLWLFERGKESASFLADMFMYQGRHTTETRAFKTQMRRDYEIIVDALSEFMRLSSESLGSIIFPGERVEDLEKEALTYLKSRKGAKLTEFASQKYVNKAEAALFLLAIRFHSEGELLISKINEVLEARLRETKYGQYISPSGKAFDTKSPTFMDDVIADIKEQKEKEKVEEKKEENEDGKE